MLSVATGWAPTPSSSTRAPSADHCSTIEGGCGDPTAVRATRPLPGLTYNLGFAHHHRADAGGRSENDAVAGLAYRFAPLENLAIELLSEYAHLHHAEGYSERRHYFTQSAAAYWGGWNVAFSYTGRWIRGRDGGSSRDFLFQASAGYVWEIGAGGRFGVIGADVGWRGARSDGAYGDGIGALVSYVLAL